AAYMEAYAAANMPGAPHQNLARMAGTWNTEVKMFMGPEPMEVTGTSTIEVVMDGRFIRETVEGEFQGEQFHAVSYTGYNNATGEYEASWLDNMSTGIYKYTGSANEAGNEIVLTGDFIDPVTNQEVDISMVTNLLAADHMVMKSYEDRGDGEKLTMEVHYRK
ncbi:MAG: DUF1579 domain-containing protein, partial [Gemmatimonadales bacterium]